MGRLDAQMRKPNTGGYLTRRYAVPSPRSREGWGEGHR